MRVKSRRGNLLKYYKMKMLKINYSNISCKKSEVMYTISIPGSELNSHVLTNIHRYYSDPHGDGHGDYEVLIEEFDGLPIDYIQEEIKNTKRIINNAVNELYNANSKLFYLSNQVAGKKLGEFKS